MGNTIKNQKRQGEPISVLCLPNSIGAIGMKTVSEIKAEILKAQRDAIDARLDAIAECIEQRIAEAEIRRQYLNKKYNGEN